jgi:predicted Zn-dependent peptidase
MTQMLSGSELDVFRERHLDERAGIEAGTFSQQEKVGGMLGFGSVHLPTANGGRRLKALRKTVASLSDGSWNTQEALDAVRRRVLMSEHFSVYYAESQARRIGQARWHLGNVEMAFDRTERLDALTTDDIARMWQSWVANAEPSEAIVRRGKAQEVD